jgi:hypothetical protein
MNTIQLNQSEPGQEWLEVVWNQVKSLQFGSVEIVIHNARVVQLDRTERLRFEKNRVITGQDSRPTT